MELQAIKVDKDEVALKGQQIYDHTLKQKLERDHWGDVVVIEVDTGDYFLGKTSTEAINTAKEKYPNSIFYVVKIGFPAVHKFR